jgi:hypothetical protein
VRSQHRAAVIPWGVTFAVVNSFIEEPGHSRKGNVAREQGIAIELGTVSLERLARTGTYGTGYRGFMTVVADRHQGVLVGAFAVGPLASEWIGATVLAIKARIPIATLHDTPMQFPTFGEALSYAIDDLELVAMSREAR